MLSYYIKQAYRNLIKTRLITTGSISTLLFGVLSIALLATYVHSELTMDKFHKRHKDIYMTILQASPESNWEPVKSSWFFGIDFNKYPGIETATTIGKLSDEVFKLNYNNLEINSVGIATDSNFFKLFDYKLLVGNIATVLADNKTILLTETLAEKFFGDDNPLGKKIQLEWDVKREYIVNGIVEDPPANSSILFDYIIANNNDVNALGANFILTNNGFNKDLFFAKTEDIGQNHFQFTTSRHSLIALDDIYFSDWLKNFEIVFTKKGDERSLKILMIIIGIIFIITILNFSNLQIVNINASIKNIGINKISGAQGYHLFNLKLAEIILLTCISTFIISISYEAVLPVFNNIIGVPLTLGFIELLLLVVGIIGLVIMLAMIYPTIITSKLPIKFSLKNQLSKNNNLIGKQIIVVAQITLSASLLIASIVVIKQLNMMLHKDLAFNTHNVIKTEIVRPFFLEPEVLQAVGMEQARTLDKVHKDKYQFVRNELASHSSIKSFSQRDTPFESYLSPWSLINGESEFVSKHTLEVWLNHKEIFDFKLIEGRFFDETLDQSDRSKTGKVIINQTAKKHWGIEDISKVRFENSIWRNTYDDFEIIGIVEDFNFDHLSMKPQPLIMVFHEFYDAKFLIRFNEGATQSGLQFVEELFHKINPDKPFEYTFVADEATALYQKEKRLSQIYVFFTLVAFLISMNGLFVIALYDTIKRTKEIGVRKVNGAKVSEVMFQLNRDFFKWVAFSLAIAIPATYYFMNKWLENFAYKTSLSWWIFAIAGVLTLGIALLTVSYQSWKAATRNPVEALRYE